MSCPRLVWVVGSQLPVRASAPRKRKLRPSAAKAEFIRKSVFTRPKPKAPGVGALASSQTSEARPRYRDSRWRCPADQPKVPMMPPRAMPQDKTISGIISDLDGVAYRGDNPIPDAVQAFRAWHSNGVPYAFVTNNTTKSAAEFATKLC